MDWVEAGEHIHKMKFIYERAGRGGLVGLVLNIAPLVERYDSGERTEELYKAIWKID